MQPHPDVLRHLEHDHFAWLTTITAQGAPMPTPVWFVPDGDSVVVFSQPQARKVANALARPGVALNFNSDPDGQDIVVISADAEVEPWLKPSDQPGYLDKYRESIARLGLTVAEFDRSSSTRLRLVPRSVWLGPS